MSWLQHDLVSSIRTKPMHGAYFSGWGPCRRQDRIGHDAPRVHSRPAINHGQLLKRLRIQTANDIGCRAS